MKHIVTDFWQWSVTLQKSHFSQPLLPGVPSIKPPASTEGYHTMLNPSTHCKRLILFWCLQSSRSHLQPRGWACQHAHSGLPTARSCASATVICWSRSAQMNPTHAYHYIYYSPSIAAASSHIMCYICSVVRVPVLFLLVMLFLQMERDQEASAADAARRAQLQNKTRQHVRPSCPRFPRI